MISHGQFALVVQQEYTVVRYEFAVSYLITNVNWNMCQHCFLSDIRCKLTYFHPITIKREIQTLLCICLSIFRVLIIHPTKIRHHHSGSQVIQARKPVWSLLSIISQSISLRGVLATFFWMQHFHCLSDVNDKSANPCS